MGGRHLLLLFGLAAVGILGVVSLEDTSPLFEPLLRPKRDIRDEEAMDSCDEYIECAMPDDRRHALIGFYMFDFISTFDEIRRQCQGHMGVSRCGESPCRGYRAARLTMTYSIFSWLCDNIDSINNGRACWGVTFTTEMMDCTEGYSLGDYSEERLAPLLQCFANVPENREGCDESDVATVIHYTHHMASVIRTYARPRGA